MADWPYSTSAWRALRKAKLAEAPLCHPCGLRGREVPATAVDHVVSINRGGPPFPPLSGLMSLCHRCHTQKTSAVDRPGGSGVAFKGCGPDGLPIDPSHPAYQGYTGSKDGKAEGLDRPQHQTRTKFRAPRRWD